MRFHWVCPTCGTCEPLLLQPISIAWPYISLPPFPALFPAKVTELEGSLKVSVQ